MPASSAWVPTPLAVDASVSAAWFLPDEANVYTEAALAATALTEVWVPALWLLEMGNLLLNAQRRKRIDDAKRRELVAAAAGLRLRIDREPVSMVALDTLAAEHALSAYDAAYLELARRRSLPLATQDRGLRRAMAATGVPVASWRTADDRSALLVHTQRLKDFHPAQDVRPAWLERLPLAQPAGEGGSLHLRFR